ncbi:PREDICTED: uncharacterized protein LOC106315200 [Brassica oleracea var. oleracea]|uniref:uncharacterized protein LOC106315200 n=1 Tax=Brassica oleracea var. oleracea TaxID=109376 RepID=UPI0006A71454|nr:PREDICTED: uncharacterized protein LOC106315200 [Brassica oleracea var. oleracea]
MSQPSKSLNLNNKQPQEEENDDLVIFPDVDNSELIVRYQLSLVGRLFNKERRSVEGLIALLPRPSIWDVKGRARGVDLGNHRFQFDFDSETDLQKVLSKRPCHFNKWSFTLERWSPHIGDSFPNKMTFWVSVIGNVEAKAAKFELELDAELPLKFNLRAQLPSGEIVHVSLEYPNLQRWCHHCHLLSHEIDICPQLPDEQKEQFIKEKDLSRDQGPYPRKEANRNGENPRRATAPGSKAHVMQERRPVDYSQRDNRDSVWKRIDSRYAPREDHRRDHRHAPHDLEKQPHQKETSNKRRYEKSFASSRQREEVRKTTSKQLPSKKISEEEHPPSASRAQQPIDPNNQKLKGQVSDLENASDEGISAKKCLNFNEEKTPPLKKPQDAPLPPVKEKEKSWYEQTLEEEEEETLNQEIVNKPDTPVEKTMETVEDLDAEKILEDEDWMANEINYDDDDLMDEDDLLIEDMEHKEASIISAKASKQSTTDGLSALEENNKLSAKPSPQARSDHRSDSTLAQTPSSSSRPSPAKKKSGSPSPLATGVSLRQKNLLVGRATKPKASKNGPKLSPAHTQVPSETEKSEMFSKNSKKII